jgi:hypothetical protein
MQLLRIHVLPRGLIPQPHTHIHLWLLKTIFKMEDLAISVLAMAHFQPLTLLAEPGLTGISIPPNIFSSTFVLLASFHLFISKQAVFLSKIKFEASIQIARLIFRVWLTQPISHYCNIPQIKGN